jgi:hypothetical protein
MESVDYCFAVHCKMDSDISEPIASSPVREAEETGNMRTLSGYE